MENEANLGSLRVRTQDQGKKIEEEILSYFRNVYIQYGGALVSTRVRNIDCMQRVSVGLFKKPVKPLSAKQGQKVVSISDFQEQFVAADLECAAAAA